MGDYFVTLMNLEPLFVFTFIIAITIFFVKLVVKLVKGKQNAQDKKETYISGIVAFVSLILALVIGLVIVYFFSIFQV